MKTNIITSSITIIVIVVCILFAGCTDDGTLGLSPASTSRYTLSEAVDNGLIKAKITGSGASSGSLLKL